MDDEHDRHYRQLRAEYERQLDEEYRHWLANRRGGAAPEPAPEPAPAGQDESAASSLGRAVSEVVLGSQAQPGATAGVRGVYEDQTAAPADLNRSRADR